MVRIYTRGGDSGETGLIGGARVSKADPVIEAIGSLDETNAWLGMIASLLEDPSLRRLLGECQGDLFELGAELAAPGGPPRLKEQRIRELEEAIDRFAERVPPLRRFVLPGGDRAAAACHVARTVARRAERALVRLPKERAGSHATAYLNRLSDLLFVLARFINYRAGVAEPAWPGDECRSVEAEEGAKPPEGSAHGESLDPPSPSPSR